MQTPRHFFSAIGTTAVLLTVGSWANAAQAFTITGTSALFDDIELNNGNLVTSDNPYNKVKFLTDVNGTGENQVRWGSAVYGTEVTTEVEVTEWIQEGHWAESGGYWDKIHGYWDYGYWYETDEWIEETTSSFSTRSWRTAKHYSNKGANVGCLWHSYYGGCGEYQVSYTTGGYYDTVWNWHEIEWIDTSYETTYTQEVTETVVTYENQSGLGFAGVEALEVSTGESFKIGTLKHFNETIWGDGLDGLKSGFELLLDLGDSIGEKAFNFDLHIDETNNDASYHANGVCPYETDPGEGCSDQITWEFALQEAQTFTKDGEEYTLELVGFSPDEMNAANLTQAFISQEDGTSEASLWARIVKVEPPVERVPEPAGLVGLSLLGAYVIKSRRRDQQQAEMAIA